MAGTNGYSHNRTNQANSAFWVESRRFYPRNPADAVWPNAGLPLPLTLFPVPRPMHAVGTHLLGIRGVFGRGKRGS